MSGSHRQHKNNQNYKSKMQIKMDKEIENLIKKSMARDIQIKMLEKFGRNVDIRTEDVIEILEEITGEKYN